MGIALHTKVHGQLRISAEDASFPRLISSVSWLVYHLLALNCWELLKRNLKLAPAQGGQGETKERGTRSGLAGAGLQSNGTFLQSYSKRRVDLCIHLQDRKSL